MTRRSAPIVLAALIAVAAVALAGREPASAQPSVSQRTGGVAGHPDAPFLTSHECLACHNGLTTPTGEDVSIGVSWRASMMAHSARDPYWQAGVRREVLDHPAAAEAIEHECATCHMPMAQTAARMSGRRGRVFAHLPVGAGTSVDDRLAADGVSCTLCHQIGPDRLGSRESFTGGFVIGPLAAGGERRMLGPFAIDRGRAAVMRSATGMTPAEAAHLRESEVCATCHTLYTHALGPSGETIGELPEQMPYLEWRHSAFRSERSCQSCHMPRAEGPLRIASVVGEERPELGRHTFLGGNFFMLRMLNRYRDALGVEAPPQELEAAAAATIAQLQQATAALTASRVAGLPGELAFDVSVRNLTGHKLPTAYPSRRVWLHVTVRDGEGRVVFSSGAIEPTGLIRGNDQDTDGSRVEPHHTEIRREDQVQIYESVMHDARGVPTTGLLAATGYAKDNRLLPRGFDKAAAPADIAVVGAARTDPDFAAEGDRVRYVVDTAGRPGPFTIDVELRYQPIAYRWAQNLAAYDAPETRRFVAWYNAMATGSSVVLARAGLTAP